MYSLRYHSITADTWFSRSKEFQLLNIASELARAQHWIENNRVDLVNSCYDRVLELVDLTRSDPQWKSGLRELSRCREYLAGLRCAHIKDLSANRLLMRTLIQLNAKAERIFTGNNG